MINGYPVVGMLNIKKIMKLKIISISQIILTLNSDKCIIFVFDNYLMVLLKIIKHKQTNKKNENRKSKILVTI